WVGAARVPLSGPYAGSAPYEEERLEGRRGAALRAAALGLLALEDARGGAALVGVRVLHEPVGSASLVVLGQVLGDGKPLRRDEQQAVAVLPLLHLVAGADPPAQLRLGLRIGVEVAGAERSPHQLDVAREPLDDRLGHRHVRMERGAGLLRVLP